MYQGLCPHHDPLLRLQLCQLMDSRHVWRGSGVGLLGSGRDCVSRRGTLKETSPLLDEAVEL